MEDVRARACKPENCLELEAWLSELLKSVADLEQNHEERLSKMKSCKHSVLVKNGFYNYKGKHQQMYRCITCGKHGRMIQNGYSHRMKNPDHIIAYAQERIEILSTRDIAKEIKEKFNVTVSHVTIYDWAFRRKPFKIQDTKEDLCHTGSKPLL